MAQLGRAPAWGAGGRWFKSSYADHFIFQKVSKIKNIKNPKIKNSKKIKSL